ncbi:peptide deformylase [Chitinophaga terrae (ex Kim and Jung 2007)]|uniref:Peptide deformylase n=1 Tax=Chitinophaga terrae (ex Kim and Jung 2007) TaxID=408074 RepID=A0A1H4G6L7_9BACT|nr:peptide deformylase [Chitinophaga terrae (ex Kim and Jung 2007)]MDQ0105610.1 peptide deformylase [Chitinophaga terrae (ex Kim and Jung 2007)]GEP93089.1 peptide deformylase [Chitinophaga terrae (ex Kim and Jung 2007)]SEB05235.1 peptide deformylase [Chitinophaga terrae (ex Kim and Jung 2007)]
MILPIVGYGADVLRKVGAPVERTTAGLQQLIEDMRATLINARGAGLAAPQVNRSLQLFLIETPDHTGVFINPRILHYSADLVTDSEGCLSIPGITQQVSRSNTVQVTWQDEAFHEHSGTFHGETARAIQHEYDHLQGKLYLDRISALQRQLLKNKLQSVLKRKVKAPYPMVWA